MISNRDSYPENFLGQFRLYIDQLNFFILETAKYYGIFFLGNLGILFFDVEKSWSALLFLLLSAVSSISAAAIALIKVHRSMPNPKGLRTAFMLPVVLIFAVTDFIALSLYVSACVMQRQFSLRTIKVVLQLLLALPVLTLTFLIVMRFCIQARFIPSEAMKPTIQVNDRLIIESVSSLKGIPVERGQIVIFHLPSIMGKQLKDDLPTKLGELTGLPIFPNKIAYIKRVIGIPGDKIEIHAGVGVFVNDKKLDETSYITEPASDDLKQLSDIKGPSNDGGIIQPYNDCAGKPVVVPPNAVFVLGDNRNRSVDSRVFGFVDQKLIIGRAWELFYPQLHYMHTPFWHRPAGL